MDYGEIAETLGVRQAFVGVVLLRARHQLREAMGGATLSETSRGNS
jgi:DNA-directed RNA polymerase specialized sigma24 family protein